MEKCMEPTSISVCVIGPYKGKGGVSRSTLNMVLLYKYLGFNAKLIPSSILVSRKIPLHFCDVIHVQGPMFLNYIKLLFQAPRSVRIITYRGWVLEEQLTKLRYMDNLSLIRRVLSTFTTIIVYLVNKFVFIPFTIHLITAVSKITAKKNKVRAIVIPNHFFKYYIEDELRRCYGFNKDDNEVWIATYVSIGGGKFLSILRLIKTILLLNKLLVNDGKKAVLLIFGKDVPRWLEKICMKYSHVIRLMGYTNDYVCYLKYSDLFIAGYTMPELGHAVIEAVSLGVPIAKYTDNSLDEEIIDGFNGILAQHDTDMVKKIYDYVLHMKEMRDILARNAKETVLKRRSFMCIGNMWSMIVEKMMAWHC
ncbi:MAG: glycosyltransferase [Desulfurococcaceae archaeon]